MRLLERLFPRPEPMEFLSPDVDAMTEVVVEGDPEPVRIERPLAVRAAEISDEKALYEMLVAFHADNYLGQSYDPVRVLDQMKIGTEHKGGMIGVIDGLDGSIIASVGLFPTQGWYTAEWTWTEFWLFVRPEYRKANPIARDLFQFMKWVAQETNMPVATGVSSLKRLGVKERYWGRHAKRIGGLYLIEP